MRTSYTAERHEHGQWVRLCRPRFSIREGGQREKLEERGAEVGLLLSAAVVVVMFAAVLSFTLALHAPALNRASSSRNIVMQEKLPKLCVLDLDMCVWSPEMYELYEVPKAGECEVRRDLNGRGEGVAGVMSGGDCIRLFPGALLALQEVADGKYPGMRLAAASSADTPLAETIGRAAMKILEVLPGLTVYDVLTRGFEGQMQDPPERGPVNLQIGRQGANGLSSNKAATHFPILKEATGVEYSEMLFFDDSAWSDHCAMVERGCPGVVTQRTPRGMQETEWRNALRKFAQS